MIRDLLEKRDSEYKSTTKEILALYGDKLVKALRFYMKTERTIRIESIGFYSKNKNFIQLKFTTELLVGDKILASDGKRYELTEQNIKNFVSEQMDLYLPIKLVDVGTPVQIYDKIKFFDDFVKKYGPEKFSLCINSGIEDFTDLVEKEQHQHLLERLTDPTQDILAKLDNLQKVQFMLFSKDGNKVVN